MPRRDHSRAGDGVGVGHELGVRLVEHHEQVGGHLREERIERGLRHDRAGGVVGGADDHHAGAVGDGIRHSVEVVPALRVVRHHDAPRAGDHREARVGLERPPREEDLVARTARRLRQLVEDRHRPGGDVHGVVAHAVALGESRAQARGGRVGVAVERHRRLHRRNHARQRLERVLVARELERVGAGLPALLVGGERRDLGTDAHGKVTHARSLRMPRMRVFPPLTTRARLAAPCASSSASSSTPSPSGS